MTHIDAIATRTTRAARVLIVDDEPAIRRLTERVLQQAGYQTATAADGHEAIHIAEAQAPFDLLLTDVAMPGMNGDELAQQLLLREPDLNVLYCTASQYQLFVDRMALGPNERVIDKPVTAQALLDAVALALLARARRERR